MQPNQNQFGAPAVGGMPGAAPVAPTTPARPAGPAMPTMAAKPETPEAAPMAPAPVVAKKKGNGMLVGMILLAVLAIGGIGFGVYMYMEKGNVETSLNKQITALKATNADLLKQLSDLQAEEEEEAEEEAIEEETVVEEEAAATDQTVVESTQDTTTTTTTE